MHYGQQLVAMLIFTVVGFALAANVWKINDHYVALQQRLWSWSDETSVVFVKIGRIGGAVIRTLAFSFALVTLVEWANH